MGCDFITDDSVDPPAECGSPSVGVYRVRHDLLALGWQPFAYCGPHADPLADELTKIGFVIR